MKMDLRQIVLIIATLALAACGKQKTSSQTFQKLSEECVADVAPGRFMARFKDGSVRTVEAPSKQAFLEGYVSKHLDDIDFTEHDFYVRSSSIMVRANATADNWGPQRIRADALWSDGVRGAGATVAVVDSGMDLTHPSLSGQIAANSNEIPGNGVDDDRNGFVDDVGGVDFILNQPLTGDYKMHGTHVAGIIAAAHSDNLAAANTYVQGVAPDAKILPLAFLNEYGSGLMSNGVRAINYAVSRGAKVINASWGGTVCSKSLRDTVAGLAARNVMFIAAAGNEATNIDRYKEYPASLGGASQITVGATGFFDILAEFSNYGMNSVHIFAPGADIVSTIPGGVGALSGTSMAAPFVSGAVALLLSAEPGATPELIRQALFTSAYKQAGYLNASNGRLDLRSALTELRHLLGR